MSRLIHLPLARLLGVFVMNAVAHAYEIKPGTVPPEPSAVSSRADAIEPDQVARRVLATADLVLQKHIDPPTRRQMILAAIRALAEKAGQPLPTGHSRRISGLATNEELRRLIKELWADARKTQQAADEDLQTAML